MLDETEVIDCSGREENADQAMNNTFHPLHHTLIRQRRQADSPKVLYWEPQEVLSSSS